MGGSRLDTGNALAAALLQDPRSARSIRAERSYLGQRGDEPGRTCDWIHYFPVYWVVRGCFDGPLPAGGESPGCLRQCAADFPCHDFCADILCNFWLVRRRAHSRYRYVLAICHYYEYSYGDPKRRSRPRGNGLFFWRQRAADFPASLVACVAATGF